MDSYAWRTRTTELAGDRTGQVTNLRYARHDKYDRVVIDFSEHISGYRIGYVPELTYDGSGEPILLEGTYKMSLSLYPANAHTEEGANVYAGPRRVTPNFPALRGVVFAGDYEGYVSFAFTTEVKLYRIFRLWFPRRLVIDWRRPPTALKG